MHRTLVAIAAVGTTATTFAAVPAHADPPADSGVQTSGCDNGQTYVYSLREVGNPDRSRAFGHVPVHDPASNAVLTLVSGSAIVTIDDGQTVETFPVEYGRPRAGSSGHLTTCASTYDVVHGPVHVHVESTDVFLVSGRR